MMEHHIYRADQDPHSVDRDHAYRTYRHGSAVNWGAVIAGTIASLALSILFSFLVAGLGFGTVDMHAENPFAGLGAVVNVSSAMTVLFSLAAGSYIAGRLAGKAGMVHGFLNWALMTLLTTIISFMAISTTAKLASSAVSSTISGASSVVSNASQFFTNSDDDYGFSKVFGVDNIEQQIEQAKANIAKALNNTDISALRTENLSKAFADARDDVTQAIEQFKSDPSNYKAIMSQLVSQLKQDAGTISQNVNRAEVVNELVSRGWAPEDAQKAADKAVGAYEEVRDNVSQQLDKAQDFIANMPQNVQDMKERAADGIDNAAGTMQKATLWTFFGGLASALISALAGYCGERSRFARRPRIEKYVDDERYGRCD